MKISSARTSPTGDGGRSCVSTWSPARGADNDGATSSACEMHSGICAHGATFDSRSPFLGTPTTHLSRIQVSDNKSGILQYGARPTRIDHHFYSLPNVKPHMSIDNKRSHPTNAKTYAIQQRCRRNNLIHGDVGKSETNTCWSNDTCSAEAH